MVYNIHQKRKEAPPAVYYTIIKGMSRRFEESVWIRKWVNRYRESGLKGLGGKEEIQAIKVYGE